MLKKMVFVFLAIPILMFARGGGGPVHPSSTGLHLLHSFWSDMSAKKVDKISTYMSSQFQGVYNFTAEDKFGELTLIRERTIPAYSLLNLQQTQRGTGEGALLNMTYTVQFADQEYHTSTCSTCWLQIEEGDWRLMSHSEVIHFEV